MYMHQKKIIKIENSLQAIFDKIITYSNTDFCTMISLITITLVSCNLYYHHPMSAPLQHDKSLCIKVM